MTKVQPSKVKQNRWPSSNQNVPNTVWQQISSPRCFRPFQVTRLSFDGPDLHFKWLISRQIMPAGLQPFNWSYPDLGGAIAGFGLVWLGVLWKGGIYAKNKSRKGWRGSCLRLLRKVEESSEEGVGKMEKMRTRCAGALKNWHCILHAASAFFAKTSKNKELWMSSKRIK